MAQYDPQRSRSRHRSGDDEGPAPVDALLESAGSSDPSSPPDLIDLTDTASAATTTGPDIAATNGSGPPPWSDASASTHRAPVKAVVASMAVVVGLVLAWAWLRRRRQPPASD